MIAWLDAQLPPLDPALGFILLLAVVAGFGLARLLDRPARGTVPDPHACEYGDMPQLQNSPKGGARARDHIQA